MKFISIRFSETSDPMVFLNQTTKAEADMPPLARFRFSVPNDTGQVSSISIEPTGWPFTYDTPYALFLNDSWAFGTSHLAANDRGTGGSANSTKPTVKSVSAVDFTYDSVARILEWHQSGSKGWLKLDVNTVTPVWYVTLRLSNETHIGELIIGGKVVCRV
ncbi:hypothetical protein [Oleiharenicola lentus]|uniref:hypothetical protein n=1 Tax=Oleiharenicola lentus TaxID=2508720 RepID=UPI003F661B5D